MDSNIKTLSSVELLESESLQYEGQKKSALSELLVSSSAALRLESKRPTMIIVVLTCYVLLAAFFTPRMIELFEEARGLFDQLVIGVFILQTHVFWLYGSFFAAQAVFSSLSQPRIAKPPRILSGPPVAILYTTMHDFQEKAVLSCIHQEYANCHTFILDDSKNEDAKRVVDEFAERYPDDVTVVRRTDRVGYKAGNINNALENHVHGFEYFAIADADSVFPPFFIAELLPYFANDARVGFVQGGFEPDPHPGSKFSRDLGLQIRSMWKVFAPARNRYGSVIFLGHGGIIRYDVWKAIGGFPPLISEDLALSHRARRLGYRGRFVPQVKSFEEFPDSYIAFRKQQKRYVQGICQYIHYDLGPYLKSRNVTWFEKVDTLLTCGGLLMPIFFLSFIVLYSIVMPFMFGVHNLFAINMGGTEILFPIFLLSERFFDLGLSLDYFLITGFCTLAPTLGGFWLMMQHPFRGARTIWLAAAPYMSLLVMSSVAIVGYMLFRTATFTATGDRSAVTKPAVTATTDRRRLRLKEDDVARFLEFGLGAALAVMCIATLNIVLFSFAVAILLAPVLGKVRWNHWLLRPWLYLPFLALTGGLLLGAITLAQKVHEFSLGFPWIN